MYPPTTVIHNDIHCVTAEVLLAEEIAAQVRLEQKHPLVREGFPV